MDRNSYHNHQLGLGEFSVKNETNPKYHKLWNRCIQIVGGFNSIYDKDQAKDLCILKFLSRRLQYTFIMFWGT